VGVELPREKTIKGKEKISKETIWSGIEKPRLELDR